jgi:hypothetical protein
VINIQSAVKMLAVQLRGFVFCVLFLGLATSGCAPRASHESLVVQTEPPPIHTAIPVSTVTPEPVIVEPALLQVPQTKISLTYPNLDGNRVVEGAGFHPDSPVDIPLMGKPLWVAAAAMAENSVWYVALETGQVQAFQVQEGVVSEVQANVPNLPPSMPPVLVSLDEVQTGILQPVEDAAVYTNPLLDEDGRVVHVRQDGSLSIAGSEGVEVLPIDVLPDARIVSNGADRLMVLSRPSDKYPHTIMGDAFEATGITIIDTLEKPFVIEEIIIKPDDVIEGLAPIWVDMNGDGHREIVVTQSNAIEGSRIVVYSEDGSVLAQGAPVGQGFRWIHQVAVGQFIESGSLEIATVRTPHIGGVVEIYSLEGDQLVVVDSLSGYSSHRIGSRNLDGALAGDFNGDDVIELVVPDQTQTNLHGIQFSEDGLTSIWNVPLGGRLSTNLVGLELADGRLALGAGTENQILRIWIP